MNQFGTCDLWGNRKLEQLKRYKVFHTPIADRRNINWAYAAIEIHLEDNKLQRLYIWLSHRHLQRAKDTALANLLNLSIYL